MFIVHIALQGCLRGSDVEYGVTADTGGHIRYLLELVEAAEQAGVHRQEIITRAFDDESLGDAYKKPRERLGPSSDIIRLRSQSSAYLSKEELGPELPSLADALEAHLLSLPELPDVIHAHYADAGWLAARMKERLGIPYFFTAHSLGRVKQQALRQAVPEPSLACRIEIEEEAIASADRIVVSSSDEAVRQYGLYKAQCRSAILLNPPGCDLQSFTGVQADQCPDALQMSIERFLTDPSKKPILALSRPVEKKNLAGLVKAFGEDAELREHSNLILFAGTRQDIRLETEENRRVLEELLYLIDLYDLWGAMAMPKNHLPSDVPHIYQYAAARRGVFCNPALNEPFGLTLLEAAASGLPVGATYHGGPRDITATCQHGTLVDPFDTSSIADGLRKIVSNDAEWERYAQNGRKRSAFYSWRRHVKDYLVDVQNVAGSGRRRLERSQEREAPIVASAAVSTNGALPRNVASSEPLRPALNRAGYRPTLRTRTH
jgi:sucrose-phosphate synthase